MNEFFKTCFGQIHALLVQHALDPHGNKSAQKLWKKIPDAKCAKETNATAERKVVPSIAPRRPMGLSATKPMLIKQQNSATS